MLTKRHGLYVVPLQGGEPFRTNSSFFPKRPPALVFWSGLDKLALRSSI